MRISFVELTERLVSEFSRKHPNVLIEKFYMREKSLIRDWPLAGMHVEIKPNNTGLFILAYPDFKFFDLALLKNYWERTLKHEAANYIFSSDRIYIYPKSRINVKSDIEILDYTSTNVSEPINRIKDLLTR